jgi:hypothetical protein
MSAENIDNPPISYEQLEDLEDDFEQVELELRKFLPLLPLNPDQPFPLCFFWRWAVENASFCLFLLESRNPQMSSVISPPLVRFPRISLVVQASLYEH